MARNENLAVVILAAGKGSRMKSTLPKVMHKLAGRHMLGWLLETVESLEPARVVVVTAPDMDDVKHAASPHSVVIQKDQDGTGGAVRAALTALVGFNGNVLILLGDTPMISAETLLRLVAARQACGLAVLGVHMDNPYGYGRLICGPGDTLRKIVEEKDASAQEKSITLVNTGAFCVDGSKLGEWVSRIDRNNAQGEYYITDLPKIAAADGYKSMVCVAGNAAELQGCNTRADLAAMERSVQIMLRRKIMDNGVTLADPETVYFAHDTIVESDVVIEPNVYFGPGVRIESGAVIHAFSYLEGVRVGRNASIGPFARLRPGSEIGENARVGNFVEIKKSKIGKGSKIGHLAYVGDCTMGKDVNFSAGAITVNYDGFEKHDTTIGNGVMIGSNVNLIAPLTIDDGAFVAAGSTITDDVPADALSISRESTRVREGWAAEYRKRKKAVAEKSGKKKGK